MKTDATFIFKAAHADLAKGEAHFEYLVVLPGGKYTFEETLLFSPFSSKIPEDLVQVLLNNILLVLGLSYWKLYCPKKIIIEPFTLSKDQARFWDTLYTKGLGEFFYQNNIDFRDLVHFPYNQAENSHSTGVSFPRQDRTLLPIGGGKDSIVSAELLKAHDKPYSAFIVNPKPLHEEIISILGTEGIMFKRTIDAGLFALNKKQGTYNGHVPATAMNSFLGLLAAIFYDYRYVIVSNEHSANFGNVTYLGKEINHQWSKSEEFEQLFQEYTKTYITPSVTYFSLLRPFTEIKITALFTKYEQYFPYFSSCNRNFRITEEESNTIWCGKCPKCLFVFTMLAAYLPKEKLLMIFGKNLFENTSLTYLYKELLGLGEIKPFECVGTPQEMKYAMYLIHKKGEFETTSLMQIFVKEALPSEEDISKWKKELFKQKPNFVPPQWKYILKNV